MVRVRSRPPPPAVVCSIYSAIVLPIVDYCDVVWRPTTASVIEGKILNKSPLPFYSKFSNSRFHTSIQNFKFIHHHTCTIFFIFPKILLFMLAETSKGIMFRQFWLEKFILQRSCSMESTVYHKPVFEAVI